MEEHECMWNGSVVAGGAGEIILRKNIATGEFGISVGGQLSQLGVGGAPSGSM
jgi:hypothetical protein